MEEKIGINIQEASEILGISKQLMTELTKLKDFPCIKFERRIVINKPKMIEWFDKNAGRIHIQKIRTREDVESVLYLFLQSGGVKDKPVVVQEYLENPGTVKFAEYIYLTGEPEDLSMQLLNGRGQVTVIQCGGKGSDSEGVQITWKFGLQRQDKDKKQNTDNSCPVFCWKLG